MIFKAIFSFLCKHHVDLSEVLKSKRLAGNSATFAAVRSSEKEELLHNFHFYTFLVLVCLWSIFKTISTCYINSSNSSFFKLWNDLHPVCTNIMTEAHFRPPHVACVCVSSHLTWVSCASHTHTWVAVSAAAVLMCSLTGVCVWVSVCSARGQSVYHHALRRITWLWLQLYGCSCRSEQRHGGFLR